MIKAHILIVEDEALIAQDIRCHLLQMNHDVLGIVDCGEKAVELAKALRPNLVLMDGTLKGSMNGFEAGPLIEELLGCPNILRDRESSRRGFAALSSEAIHSYRACVCDCPSSG